MKTKTLLAAPLIALASLSNSPDAAGSQKNETALCEMPLPQVEILEIFEGSVSEPFILALAPGFPKRDISLLSMNIQNIPFAESQNPDYRPDRKNCLKELSRQFDAVAFQEDFNKREMLAGPVWKPKFARKAILKTGSPGLSFQSRLPYNRVSASAFSDCSGLFGRKNDCLASKGYQVMQMQGVTIINTHLDAGRDRADQLARASQLDELSQAIPAQGPVLLTGDLNLYIQSVYDENLLAGFLTRNDLTLFKRYSPEKGHDFVIGRDIDINWIGKVEDSLLSDHAGLVVNFSPRKPAPQLYANIAP